MELAVVPQEKNWKGIILSIIVIVIVCVIVGVSAYFLQPPENSTAYKYTYDFNAMFSAEWNSRDIKGQWVGEYLVYHDSYFNFVRRKGDAVEILISNISMMNYPSVYDTTISPDFKYALISYKAQKVYRHSTLANYSIYTIDTGDQVTPDLGRLQYASWGENGSQLFYVLNSDMYYKDSAKAPAVEITNSGRNSNGKIKNGIADWIYEEEMFHDTLAYWVSKDGSCLGYVMFDDTAVMQMDIVVYNTEPYPSLKKVSYPKAGFENPKVEVILCNLKTKEKLKLAVPETVTKMDPIINSFVWVSGNEALVTWSNRYQNISVVAHCVAPEDFSAQSPSSTCKEVYKRENDGWIFKVGREPVRGPGSSFLLIEEQSQLRKGKFHHILLVDYSTGSTKTRFLTSGNWEVTHILSYHADNDRVYFIGTKTSPMDRHLYSVSTTKLGDYVCHSCGEICKYVDITMSDSANWTLLNCKGPNVPHTTLLNLVNGEDIVLETNEILRERLKNTKLPKVSVETVRIKGEMGTYDFQGKLYLPPDIETMNDVPILLDVYAGPGYQHVSSQFSLSWTTYLTTNKGIAVFTFDGRGSGYRGSKSMKEVNRKLGVYEIEDQITALKEILKRHPNLSRRKIGVWGWSYGGYSSMRIATHPSSLYENFTKCVISVSPVTDWRLYDSMYTERYMGSPINNDNNYEKSSVLKMGSSFKFFKFLLVHGTEDDNVHFQNSALLEKELVRKGIVHRYQVYTDEAHSLANDRKYTHMHLFKMLTEFLTECYANT